TLSHHHSLPIFSRLTCVAAVWARIFEPTPSGGPQHTWGRIVDPEARHLHKSGQQRDDGCKAHLAVEPETGPFTAIALTPTRPSVHRWPSAAGLLPGNFFGLIP
ncbi:hypothetical protein, partial [Nonomuraea sp. NPDC003201]